jgi:hypothetical protein
MRHAPQVTAAKRAPDDKKKNFPAQARERLCARKHELNHGVQTDLCQ